MEPREASAPRPARTRGFVFPEEAGHGRRTGNRGPGGARGAGTRLGRGAARRGRARPDRRHAPLRCARHGRGRPRSLSGREAGYRPGHRQRLLLRLRPAPLAHAGGPRGGRGADGGQRRGGAPVRQDGARLRRRAVVGCRRRADLQGGDPRRPRDAGARRGRASPGHDLLRARAVQRPVQGPARGDNRGAWSLQAPLRRRRVLAGRREAADAAADLRHGLGDAGGAGPVPVAPGGGEEARPPQAGRAPRPLQLPRREPRGCLLAPEGLAALPDAARRDARAPGPARVRGGQHSAARPPEALGAVGPLGALPGQHVPRRGRGADVQPQAHELPRIVVHLPQPAAVLSGPAIAAGRVRRAPSQGALGGPLGSDPGTQLRHGRRPHLRPAGPDRGRDRGLDGGDPGGLLLVRPHADPHLRHAARQGSGRHQRLGRDGGDHAGRAGPVRLSSIG